ncbi:hypothetical protein OE749_08425 [Aestuariibacter sp. AA17]|uniref:Uncharacterized protein n=1 Tax=Fluctibacter corallii TaxID=2984329 RepID=A0ABT3A7T4_9ALTE|nr:hypothetical protein [Aestuariibacter sp. AA17]MCV2884719.1 hypothetical protein [Aestuariibacter sp. AA17]
MHDWTLIEISVFWKAGLATLSFRDSESDIQVIKAHKLRKITIPRELEWGNSVSVSKVTQSESINGAIQVKVEIQSGDTIEVLAQEFEFPD